VHSNEPIFGTPEKEACAKNRMHQLPSKVEEIQNNTLTFE
jgi:hypothetical protein